MMFTELNASGYEYNRPYYDAEFDNILSKIVLCYNLMIAENVVFSNDENAIRDVFYLNYLNDNKARIKLNLTNYYFDRETVEDKTVGRTDIRVLTSNSFQDTSAYYIIECKRLNAVNSKGTTGLNAMYIKEGICRFTSQTYSSYYKTSGMIGFVVQEINIHENIECINILLKDSFKEANTINEISKRKLINLEFDYSYYSTHRLNKEEITINHLMLDFSKNVN